MNELINHSLLQMTNENGESTGILYPQNDGTDVSIDTSKNSSIPANVSNVQDLTNNLGGAAFLPSSDITNLQDDVTTLQNQAKGIILSVPEANWSTSGSGYVNTLTVNGITGNETLTASLYDTGSLTEAEITTFDEIITKMETKTNQIVLTASEKPTVSFSIVLTGEFSINNQGFSNLGDVQKSIDTVNNRVTVVNNRINSLATLTEGSTTGDAELMDIRNGANGVTYASAGDAVRGQVTEIKEDLSDFDFINIGYKYSLNILNKSTVTIGKHINSSGQWVYKEDVYESDFIPVEHGRYYINPDYEQNVCFYDSSKTFIGVSAWTKHDGNSSSFFDVSGNTRYIRCFGMILNLDTDMVSKDSYPNEYVPYKQMISDANLQNLIDNQSDYRKSVNLFNSSSTEMACYYDENNEKIIRDDIYESDFIPCEYGVYSINPSYIQKVLLFDNDKVFVGFIDTIDGIFTVPENVKYFRFFGFIANIKTDMAVRVSEINSVIKSKDYPALYVPFNYVIPAEMQTQTYKNWFNKTCVQLGDSITWYDGHINTDNEMVKGYASYLRELGICVYNLGVSGSTITNLSTETPICTMVDHISDYSYYDLVTIAGGVNDYEFYNSPLGDFANDNFDKSNFTQAYQYIIEKIISSNNTIQLVLITPIKNYHKTDKNTQGLLLKDYVQRIKEIGNYYSVPVLDLYAISGINAVNASYLTLEGLHPNNLGYKKICEHALVPFMSKI